MIRRERPARARHHVRGADPTPADPTPADPLSTDPLTAEMTATRPVEEP